MFIDSLLNRLPFLFSLSEIRVLFKSFKDVYAQSNVGSTSWLVCNFINSCDGLLVVHGSLLKQFSGLRFATQPTSKSDHFLCWNYKGRSPTLEPHPIPLSLRQLYPRIFGFLGRHQNVTQLSHRNHRSPYAIILMPIICFDGVLKLWRCSYHIVLDPTDDLRAVSLLADFCSANLDLSSLTFCDPTFAFTM
jgi:hypothetical protein